MVKKTALNELWWKIGSNAVRWGKRDIAKEWQQQKGKDWNRIGIQKYQHSMKVVIVLWEAKESFSKLKRIYSFSVACPIEILCHCEEDQCWVCWRFWFYMRIFNEGTDCEQLNEPQSNNHLWFVSIDNQYGLNKNTNTLCHHFYEPLPSSIVYYFEEQQSKRC